MSTTIMSSMRVNPCTCALTRARACLLSDPAGDTVGLSLLVCAPERRGAGRTRMTRAEPVLHGLWWSERDRRKPTCQGTRHSMVGAEDARRSDAQPRHLAIPPSWSLRPLDR